MKKILLLAFSFMLLAVVHRHSVMPSSIPNTFWIKCRSTQRRKNRSMKLQPAGKKKLMPCSGAE